MLLDPFEGFTYERWTPFTSGCWQIAESREELLNLANDGCVKFAGAPLGLKSSDLDHPGSECLIGPDCGTCAKIVVSVKGWKLFLTSQEPLEIFDKICSYLNMADFWVFRQVCKRYYQVENLQRRFNINILLHSFVSKPQIFRSELGKHDTLISGVFALNFFDLGWSNAPVLDLFVEAGGQKDGIVAYIKDREDYDKEDYLDITMGVERIIFSSSKRPGKTIRLTATHGPPVEIILRDSYVITSVNFITWNKAYSIFPGQTLIHHKSHALRVWDDEFGSVLREQVNQGWTNRDIIWLDLPTDARHRISNGRRRVGDQSSLVISLDTNNVQRASTPDSAIEFAQFEIFTEPQSPFENGIPYYSDISCPSGFQPETWDYADDQIPAWYKEWEQTPAEEIGIFGRNRNGRRRGA